MKIDHLFTKLSHLIALEGVNSREEVAGFIVGELIGDYDGTYEGLQEKCPIIGRIADLASDLEWSNGSSGELDAMWQEMCDLIRNKQLIESQPEYAGTAAANEPSIITNVSKQLEEQLENMVLDKYALLPGLTTWHAHDTVGPDDIVHYFSRNDTHYALVWNDFPNTTFIHEENLPPVLTKNGKDEWLYIETGDLAGYYSLYQDSRLAKRGTG